LNKNKNNFRKTSLDAKASGIIFTKISKAVYKKQNKTKALNILCSNQNMEL
jgi:hypothetical protein